MKWGLQTSSAAALYTLQLSCLSTAHLSPSSLASLETRGSPLSKCLPTLHTKQQEFHGGISLCY